MIDWGFGEIINSSWGTESIKGFIEQELTEGSRRETFTDINDIINGYIIVEDILEFEIFFSDTTQKGTLPFNYYDCINDVTRVATFVGKPTNTKISNRYKVNITLSLAHLPIANPVPESEANRITECDDNRITEGGDQRITE